MRESEKTLTIVYASLIFPTIASLSLLAETRLDVYVSLFIIEFFLTSEFISPLGLKRTRRQVAFSIGLLGIFSVIVLQRLLEILS